MQSAKATLKQVRREAEQCMSVGDYVGAFVRWSHAIAGSPAQDDTYAHALAQRSRCLLKIGNHYYALQDARRAAELDPDATQGYQRLAEVYFSSCHFAEAHEQYRKCFQLAAASGEQEAFMDWMKVCKREMAKEKAINEKYPWVGAAVGIVISVGAVVADHVMLGPDSCYLIHPLLKVLVVLGVSLTCFYFARKYREYMVKSREALLEKPPDLGGGDDDAETLGGGSLGSSS